VFDDWAKIVPKDFPVGVSARKPKGSSNGTPEGIEEIFWIEQPGDGSPHTVAPRLAIVLRPRGGQFLRGELIKFKEAGIRILVSLMEGKEAIDFGLAEEPALAEEVGLMFLPFPMRDRSVPRDPNSFRGFVQDLAGRLKAGRAVGIHCQGSIGRATVTAACTLIHLGWKPSAALAAVHEARGCMVPDTQEQEDWILSYKA
jgi:hypothetical protein